MFKEKSQIDISYRPLDCLTLFWKIEDLVYI